MQTKVVWFSFLILIFASPASGGDWRATPFELYAGIGTVSYFGDIGGSADENTWYGIKDLDILRSRPGIMAGLRYFASDYVGVSGSLALGWLSGNDTGGRNEERGYIFNTIIFEPLARIEFFPVRDFMLLRGVNRQGLVRNYGTFSAYLFAGAGAVIYHVMPNENLRERQKRDNIEHGMVTMVLPAGVGVKLGLSNRIDIGFEIGGRYALNDYLDGFTSPFASSNDIYYLTTVQLIFRLPGIGPGDI